MWHVFQLRIPIVISHQIVIIETLGFVSKDVAIRLASEKTLMPKSIFEKHYSYDYDETLDYLATNLGIKVENISKSSFVTVFTITQGDSEGGMLCGTCDKFFEFAEPNQDDGTLKCWECRNFC